MTTEQLSGRLLDEQIALAMGWTFVQVQGGGCLHDNDWLFGEHWHKADGSLSETEDGDGLPAYSSSVDALIAGPETKLLNVGWELVVGSAGLSLWMAEWRGPRDTVGEHHKCPVHGDGQR